LDLASRLAERWYEECQERSLPTDSYHALKNGLRDFLPAEALAGIAYRDDQPFVLALAAGVLLFFEPPDADRRLDALALPLTALGSLAATCRLESGMQANYRMCTWTLTDTAGVRRSHFTRCVLGNGFDSDNGGEGVMLSLADRLGWPIPLHLENTAQHSGAAR